jgi:hypothetical protein
MSSCQDCPQLGCIPDMNTYFPEFLWDEVQTIKCCNPNGNQIYSTIYAAGKSLQLVSDGIGPLIQNNLEDWYFSLTLAIVIPWVIVACLIIVVLIIGNILSIPMGIVFIIITLTIGILSALWILYNTGNVLVTTYDQAKNLLNTNWEKYQDDIGVDIYAAYVLECSETPNEQYLCCGFDYENNCVDCLINVTVNPNVVQAGATGIMTITIEDPPIGGTINIPPDLNGGTAYTETFPGGETFVLFFIYNVIPDPINFIVNITVNMTFEGIGPITINAPVDIINVIPGVSSNKRSVSKCCGKRS